MPEVKTGIEGVLKYRASVTGSSAAAAGSVFGFLQGASFEFSNNPLHVYDGSAYSHSKPQRGKGKLTAKKAFVNDADYTVLVGSTGSETQKRNYMELQVSGVFGTVEKAYAFWNCVLDNKSWDFPEEDAATDDFSFFFSFYEELTAANKRIT